MSRWKRARWSSSDGRGVVGGGSGSTPLILWSMSSILCCPRLMLPSVPDCDVTVSLNVVNDGDACKSASNCCADTGAAWSGVGAGVAWSGAGVADAAALAAAGADAEAFAEASVMSVTNRVKDALACSERVAWLAETSAGDWAAAAKRSSKPIGCDVVGTGAAWSGASRNTAVGAVPPRAVIWESCEPIDMS
jgi:hypothetical protein